MEFQWDKRKATSNLKKHGISFQEAATVFGDPMAITYYDPDHSIEEQRFLTFGITRNGKPTVVAHTESDDMVRIISARRMTKHERIIYEED